MVCTLVDLCVYPGEGGGGVGREGRRLIALFILNLPWWLHFSTSTRNLITRSWKLLLRVMQLKFHLILRVAFHSVPSPPWQIWELSFGSGRNSTLCQRENEGKNWILKIKWRPSRAPPLTKQKRSDGGAWPQVGTPGAALIGPWGSWLGGANQYSGKRYCLVNRRMISGSVQKWLVRGSISWQIWQRI